jgi:hypothetical protein
MSTSVAWEDKLQSWLEPFLIPLRHPARRVMSQTRFLLVYTGKLALAGSRRINGLAPVL